MRSDVPLLEREHELGVVAGLVDAACAGEGAALVVLTLLLVLALGGLVVGVIPVVAALASVSGSLLALVVVLE